MKRLIQHRLFHQHAGLYKSVGMLLLVFFTQFGFAEPLTVAITGQPHSDPFDPSYFYEQVLILALEKTRESDGDFVIVHNDHGGGIERDKAMLVAGAGIDVMWASVTRERLEKMRVVPVDLLKDLNNYRVLLISKDSQAAFNNIHNLEDLKKFTAGSGTHWTEGAILKDNGIQVTTSTNYYGLFKMLSAHRFDFMSRGLHEIGYDLRALPELGVTPENHVLLKYEHPIQYSFFVNKNNEKLASRLERGLKLAQSDGSFDSLFRQMPSFQEGEDILRHSHRVIIELQNDATQ